MIFNYLQNILLFKKSQLIYIQKIVDIYFVFLYFCKNFQACGYSAQYKLCAYDPRGNLFGRILDW